MKNLPVISAQGGPGLAPYTPPGLLSGLGKSFHSSSLVAFELARGMVSRVYYPRENVPCATSLEFMVTAEAGFFSAEGRHTHHEVRPLETGIPAYHILNTCKQGRYRIRKEIVTDPLRDTLLQHAVFSPLQPNADPLADASHPFQLFVTLQPAVPGKAWVGGYKDTPLLFARVGEFYLALGCSRPWLDRSVGFSGASDGWMDLAAHGRLTRQTEEAEGAYLSLTGGIELGEGKNVEILLVLGFGKDPDEAGNKVRAGLLEGFPSARERYMAEWRSWQHSLSQNTTGQSLGRYLPQSTLVLRLQEVKGFPGAILSGRTEPWATPLPPPSGAPGPYGLVHTRNLIHSVYAYLALGAREDALRILHYILAAQEADGHWPRSLEPNGQPCDNRVQLDLVGHVLLLVDACRRSFLFGPEKSERIWAVVHKAISCLILHGPVTPLDRWGIGEGISPYTLAVTVAALLAAADMAEERQEPGIATYCRRTADYLNDQVEAWTYVRDTPLAREWGVDGYYVHLAPNVLSTDALALVRYGLRGPDDPRILNTVRIIDSQLRIDTPSGPAWLRYSGDTYGETPIGEPWAGKVGGIGRPWPLLVAERAAYELVSGRRDRAASLQETLESFAHDGYFPEQIWDGHALPARALYPAKPTGSVLPHLATQAEYIRLCVSMRDQKITDSPRFTRERYLEKKPESGFVIWRPDFPCPRIPRGKKLRLELSEAALIHWTDDHWTTKQHSLTRDTQLGVQVAEIQPKGARSDALSFTFFWLTDNRWENKDFTVQIEG